MGIRVTRIDILLCMVQIQEPPQEGINAALAAEVRAEMARRRPRMTYGELAEASGVPLSSLKRYITAERHFTVQHLAKVASGLGISSHDLLDRATERWERVSSHPDAEDLSKLSPEHQREILAAEEEHADQGRTTQKGRAVRRKSV